MNDKQIEKLENLVNITMQNLSKMQEVLDHVKEEERRSKYRNMPGIEGTYDGSHLVAEDNTKVEVPANYAAKSRLVYGDTLKMIEENGKTLFKQLQKVPRKEVTGVVTKKEGKWYVLTDGGSHRLLDVAAEFNKLEANDQVEVLLPESNLSVPFAALEKVLTQKEPKASVIEDEKIVKPVETREPAHNNTNTNRNDRSDRRPARRRPAGRTQSSTPRSSNGESAPKVPVKLAIKPADSGTEQNIEKEFVMDLAADKDKKIPTTQTNQTSGKSVLEDDDLR